MKNTTSCFTLQSHRVMRNNSEIIFFEHVYFVFRFYYNTSIKNFLLIFASRLLASSFLSWLGSMYRKQGKFALFFLFAGRKIFNVSCKDNERWKPVMYLFCIVINLLWNVWWFKCLNILYSQEKNYTDLPFFCFSIWCWFSSTSDSISFSAFYPFVGNCFKCFYMGIKYLLNYIYVPVEKVIHSHNFGKTRTLRRKLWLHSF